MFFLKVFREFYSVQNFKRLLRGLPFQYLHSLVDKHEADKWIEILFTEKILMLHIFINLLQPKYATLRRITSQTGNLLLQLLTTLSQVSRSGLSDRHKTLKPHLFAELLEAIIQLAGKQGKEVKKEISKVRIFDTTFITLSLKLLPWACRDNGKAALKLGLRIDQRTTLPDKLLIAYKNLGDNLLFEQFIDLKKQGITYIFDRGFNRITGLDTIAASGNFFITRMYGKYKFEVVSNRPLPKPQKGCLDILADQIVCIGSRSKKSTHLFRRIVARTEEGEELVFLTNRMDLTAREVCELYRKRWAIELLFKWLKQYLKIDKLISHDPNGVQSQIYMALITHLLLFLYHQANNSKTLYYIDTLRDMQNQIINSVILFVFLIGAVIGETLTSLASKDPP